MLQKHRLLLLLPVPVEMENLSVSPASLNSQILELQEN